MSVSQQHQRSRLPSRTPCLATSRALASEASVRVPLKQSTSEQLRCSGRGRLSCQRERHSFRGNSGLLTEAAPVLSALGDDRQKATIPVLP